jgi:hypothetical protein
LSNGSLIDDKREKLWTIFELNKKYIQKRCSIP